MNRRISKGLGLAGVAALCLLSPASALAADAMSTGTVAPGTLSLTTAAAPTFGTTLDGSDKTASYTVPVTVNDARGTGVGWNATVASTLFTNLGGKTLPATASRITGVTSLAADGTTATNPTNAVSYTGGVEVPAAAVAAATGVKFFNAALDTGMGEFTVTPTVEVSIPANSYSGAYTSTLTLSSVTGP